MKKTGINIGDVYGLWVVLSDQYKKGSAHYVDAQCSCGTSRSVKKHNLISGKSVSCGCKQTQNLNRLSKNHKAHNAVDLETRGYKTILTSYKFSAKDRELAFELTDDEFIKLIHAPCIYCGILDSNARKTSRGVFRYNGIDRWSNDIGYTCENSLTCCFKCNLMKGTNSGEEFLEHIGKIIGSNKVRRPITSKKLNYYHERALATSKNSHDAQTKVGAILINKESGAVIADGYNGFIRGACDSKIPNTRPEKYKYMMHAELNLICNSVRHGISTQNCIIYCTLSPCVHCIRMIWQCGIDEIYFKELYSDFEESSNMLDLSMDLSKLDEFYKLTITPRKFI